MLVGGSSGSVAQMRDGAAKSTPIFSVGRPGPIVVACPLPTSAVRQANNLDVGCIGESSVNRNDKLVVGAAFEGVYFNGVYAVVAGLGTEWELAIERRSFHVDLGWSRI